MLQTLQLLELADYSTVTKVASFATLVSTYTEGMVLSLPLIFSSISKGST